MGELDLKLGRVRDLLRKHSLDALLLQRVSNFAWATCGAASFVNTAVADGLSSVLITPSGRYLITDNIEEPRLRQEERLEEQGWEFHVIPWFEKNSTIEKLTTGLKLGADGSYPGAVDLSSALSQLRAALTPEEGTRFRDVGRLSAAAMDAAIRAVRPGLTEHEIAACLASEASKRGMQPIVNLVATDERVRHFRHPLPTDKRMEKYAMLVLCGRKWGLVCSITRLVHFGPLPTELRQKAEAVARVDAQFIAATRPGRQLKDIFQEAVDTYRMVGYPEEWRLHHQGGLAGYEPRELVANPQISGEVSVGQAYAWNPSITGTKSEDTILIGEQENEVMTTIPAWPVITVEVNGSAFARPAILEVA